MGYALSESGRSLRVERQQSADGADPSAARVQASRGGVTSDDVLAWSQQGVSEEVKAIAWKAQVRLCARYRRLMAAGKRQTVVTTAIAREMAAFLWAIGREIQPRAAA